MANPLAGAAAPFGETENQSVAFAATVAATINDHQSVLTIAQATGALTLNLTVGASVRRGSELLIQVSADGTGRVLTYGTGFTASQPTLTITASKTFVIACRVLNVTAGVATYSVLSATVQN